MLAEIFTIENKQPKPTVHCYLIPELKAIIEKYPEDHINMLAYAFYKSCPYKTANPYADYSEYEKEELIQRDFLKKGVNNIVPDNQDLLLAVEKLNSLYETTTAKYLKYNKKNLQDIMDYIDTSEVTGGKDGDLGERIRIATVCGKVMQEFTQLEKIAEIEKDKVKNRGNSHDGKNEM